MSSPPPTSPPDPSTERPISEEPAAPGEPAAAGAQTTSSTPASRAGAQLRKGLVSVGVLVLGGLIAWGTSYLPTRFFEREADDQPPLVIDVARGHPVLAEADWDDCRGYVIPREPATIPPPPPPGVGIVEARRRWAEALGGDDAGSTLIVVTVQGRSPRSVVLTELRIRITERRPPPRGTTVAARCGDALHVRLVEVDLDRTPPRIVHVSSLDPSGAVWADAERIRLVI